MEPTSATRTDDAVASNLGNFIGLFKSLPVSEQEAVIRLVDTRIPPPAHQMQRDLKNLEGKVNEAERYYDKRFAVQDDRLSTINRRIAELEKRPRYIEAHPIAASFGFLLMATGVATILKAMVNPVDV